MLAICMAAFEFVKEEKF